MRTFTFSDEQSYKFWNIDLAGRAFTVRYGRIGLLGQFQSKIFATETEAEKQAANAIREKLRKGYQETTPHQTPPDEEAFHRALHLNPDDLAIWSAFADYLIEQGNPRGEFMQVQIALENESRSSTEQQELRQRETALLVEHQHEWLGDLAPIILNRQPPTEQPVGGDISVTFTRGWLTSIRFQHITARQAYATGKNRMARHVREIIVDRCSDPTALLPILPRTNVRRLQIGQRGYPYQCNASLRPLVENMPYLDELCLLLPRRDERLWATAMPQLRTLRLLHDDDTLQGLPHNESLTNLEELIIEPHGSFGGGQASPYIRLELIKSVAHQQRWAKLKRLTMRLSEFGDDAIQELQAGSLLQRLEYLELYDGRLTSAGATILAEAAKRFQLRHLVLSPLSFTHAGERILRKANIKFVLQCEVREPDPYMDI